MWIHPSPILRVKKLLHEFSPSYYGSKRGRETPKCDGVSGLLELRIINISACAVHPHLMRGLLSDTGTSCPMICHNLLQAMHTRSREEGYSLIQGVGMTRSVAEFANVGSTENKNTLGSTRQQLCS